MLQYRILLKIKSFSESVPLLSLAALRQPLPPYEKSCLLWLSTSLELWLGRIYEVGNARIRFLYLNTHIHDQKSESFYLGELLITKGWPTSIFHADD